MTVRDVRQRRLNEFVGDGLYLNNGGNGYPGNGWVRLYFGNGNPTPIMMNGTDIAIDGTVSATTLEGPLAATGVAEGDYGSGTAIPVLRISQDGRITLAETADLTPDGIGAQPVDSTLTALSGKATGADLLPYFTGPGAASTTMLTSFARSLLAGLDATAGLVEQTGADAFTKRAIGVGASSSIPTRGDADARYALLSGPTFTGTISTIRGTLGGTSGNEIVHTNFFDNTPVNGDSLIVRALRTADGTTWTTSCYEIVRKIDSSYHGFIRFGGTSSRQISIGFNGVERLKLQDTGNMTLDGNTVWTAGNLNPSNYLPLTGGTLTGSLTLAGDPAGPLQAATQQYVDNIAQGLDVKASVLVATTANITLSGAQTIDGVSIAAGARVLVKNQTAQAQNGMYVAASGAWSRATDMDAWTEIPGAFVFVEQGTVNGDTGWVCTANQGGTLGTTAITWTQFAGVGTYTGSGLIAVTGTTIGTSMSTARLIGRTTAGTGATEEISVGTGLTLSGGSLAASISASAAQPLGATASAGSTGAVADAGHVHQRQLESIIVAAGDETTAITTGTAKVTFRMPYAFTLTGVRASLTTAQASGSIFTVDINENGTSILSTKLTIDNGETTSVTAATPPVISDTALADDSVITVDVDQIGNGTAAGLKVTLIGRQSA